MPVAARDPAPPHRTVRTSRDRTPSPTSAAPRRPDEEPYEQRWLALGVIAMTVLLVILDATIVNIALPAVSADLEIDAATQQWIVTAYTLTFGGFLLLGGRIADFWGRKRTYLVGAGRLRRRLGPRRPGAERGDALRRPGPAGRLRRAARPGLARADHRAVHRHQGAGQGLRRLRRHRRWRLGGRAAARRRAHRVRRLALVLLGQPARRDRSPSSLAIPIVPESKAPGDTSYDIPGAVLVTLGLASFVYGFTRVAQASQENATETAAANARARRRAARPSCADSGWTDAGVGLHRRRRRCWSRRSSSSSCGPATRCCRCASCSTATAAGPT